MEEHDGDHRNERWNQRRDYYNARGHQWVQVGADYVLIAIATGVIAQIILNQ